MALRRRPRPDEGIGRGRWKEVARIHREFSRKRTAEEMEPLLARAQALTREMDGLDLIYAEIYVNKMREFLAQWRISQQRGWTQRGAPTRK